MNLTKEKKTTRIYLIVTNVLFGVLIIPSLPLIMMSVMMFDSPGSENSIITITIVLSIVAYPILAIIGIAGSWILFAFRKYLGAVLFASLPILNIIVGIIAIAMLFIFCEGSFNCHL